ncbi:hypothetical protein ERO13_A07G144750v2 [Gossypium hirsutum]|nr:hypothetical protein ERO13_A07G144750v2 [Gossypium hirsutum]
MALKRGLSSVGVQRSRSSGSRLRIVILFFFSILTLLVFFVGQGLYISDEDSVQSGFGKQNVDWRERLASQSIKNLFTKEVIDVVSTSTADLGPLSLDSFRKGNLSTSWKVIGVESSVADKATSQSNQKATDLKQEMSQVKEGKLPNDDHSHDMLTTTLRRQLRDNRREKHVAGLVQKDDEATVKLENAAIERSKAVDSAVLGKYNMWRKEIDNENSDSTVRLMSDQIILAKVYIIIASMKNKLDLRKELQIRLKESLHALGESTTDADLPHSASDKIKAMEKVLAKAREQLYDCKLMLGKLRAMLQASVEQVMSLKKDSMFLSQLAAKTVPNAIHCLSMRLTIEYYLLPAEKRKFPRSENLENPKLYHYALFSDNVLAASVVVNSTIMNAKDPSKHVFHLVTDKLNFGAMNMWFLLNPLEKPPSMLKMLMNSSGLIHPIALSSGSLRLQR